MMRLPVAKTWGGRRRGAGRKRRALRPQVPHCRRVVFRHKLPVHVTVRLAAGLCDLRSKKGFAALSGAFAKGRLRFGFQLVNFSVQGNHLHLIVEAENEQSLTRGMKGLNVRMARALNKIMGRTGRVFADRYHARILQSPTEVQRALRYVHFNYHKHMHGSGHYVPWSYRDPLSTAVPHPELVTPPRTWLLIHGPSHTPRRRATQPRSPRPTTA